MMITARRSADGSFTIVNGHMRLQVQLKTSGKAEVVDAGTGQILHVHEVDGRLVALSEDNQENIEDLTNAVINRARQLN